MRLESSHADVQRLCCLAGLPRATYYRHLAGRSRQAGDCELRDLIQHMCLKHRFYGYRRVTATLRRQGLVVNAKKVQRLMRGQSAGSAQGAVPEAACRPAVGLSHRRHSGTGPGAVSARSNLGRRHHLCASRQSLRLSCRHSRRLLVQGRGLGL
ncbi:hypothetical protein CWO91_37605 [Bradyrhizobium genosp. SA-3]|nr:hypothetical protein CWO91_37605 [Bradyrhizobium genosp. SA-3]